VRWTTNHVVRIDGVKNKTNFNTFSCTEDFEDKFLEQGLKNHKLLNNLICSDVFKQPLKGNYFSDHYEYFEIVLELCIGYEGCADP
jgi:hypothetical protein